MHNELDSPVHHVPHNSLQMYTHNMGASWSDDHIGEKQ